MKNAFFRLAGITVGVIGLFVVIVSALNFVGAKIEYSPLDHPLISQQEKPYRYSFYGLTQKNHLPEPKQENATTISIASPIIPIYFENSDWYLSQAASPVNAPPKKLSEFLEAQQLESVAFDIQSRVDASEAQKLRNIVDNVGLGERVVIFSRVTNNLREVRKVAPRWLFAINLAQSMRLQVMTALWLEKMTEFNFDFFVIDASTQEQRDLVRLVREMKRRKKLVLMTSSNHPLISSLAPFVDGEVTKTLADHP